MDTMNNFNPDALRVIFSYVPRHCLYLCICSCKAWHEIGTSNILWQQLYERDFGAFQPLAAGEMAPQPTKPAADYSTSFSSDSDDSESTESRSQDDELKQQVVRVVTEMGFSVVAGERAWWETQKDVSAAVEWILMNTDNPLLNQPLTKKYKGVDQDAFFSLKSMGFEVPEKAMIYALMKHNGDLQKTVEWIISGPPEMIAFVEEESKDDPDEPALSPEDLKQVEEEEGHWMARYRQSFESTIVTMAYIKGDWIRYGKDGWDNPSNLTITSVTRVFQLVADAGFTVPEPFPIPFPKGYSTAMFVEFDVSAIDEQRRVDVPFHMCCLMALVSSSIVDEPKSMEDIPAFIRAVIKGDTLHCAYFFNPDARIKQFADFNKDSGIDFFLSISKKKWLKTWLSPASHLCGNVAVGQRFMLFLLYKHTKEFLKKYKRYHTRKNLKTKKRRVGGFNTNPYLKSRTVNAKIVQGIIKWTTLSHVGLTFSRDIGPAWANPVFEETSNLKMFLTGISVKNRQGAGGVIVFDSKPKFKNIFSTPYLNPQDEQQFKTLMKIEGYTEDYWDYSC